MQPLARWHRTFADRVSSYSCRSSRPASLVVIPLTPAQHRSPQFPRTRPHISPSHLVSPCPAGTLWPLIRQPRPDCPPLRTTPEYSIPSLTIIEVQGCHLKSWAGWVNHSHSCLAPRRLTVSSAGLCRAALLGEVRHVFTWMEAQQLDQLGDPNMPNGLMTGSRQRLSKY